MEVGDAFTNIICDKDFIIVRQCTSIPALLSHIPSSVSKDSVLRLTWRRDAPEETQSEGDRCNDCSRGKADVQQQCTAWS